MRMASFLFFGLAACGGAPPLLASPPTDTRAATRTVESQCTRRVTPTEPLSRKELEHEAAPSDAAAAHDQLLGVWDGHAFSLDGELGEPGRDPEAEDVRTVCFDAGGRLTSPESREVEPAPRPGCVPRSRTYSVRREEEAGNLLVLEVRLTGGCPGDAGYTEPYLSLYYVHRLDDRFLVLIDGVTAEVSGYRRR